MTQNRSNWMLACAAVAALGATASTAAAQQISESRIRELIRQAAEQVATTQQTTAPPQAVPGTTRPTVRLTLDDAVKFALDRNLDIAVQRLNPEISDIAIATVRTTYHPVLTSTVGPQSATVLPASQTQLGVGGSAIVQQTMNYNAGLTQVMPWGGGSFSAQLVNFRQTSNSNNTLFNPKFQSAWAFGYTQPLLRNFRIDSTREQLVVTKLNQDISDIQVQATVTNTEANVRNAYWDYVFAVQSVDVAQQSLNLAAELVKNNQTKVQIGTLAPIDVVQAQSQAATQRQALVTAQGTARTAEITLKRLLVGGTNDPIWTSTIDPVDRPDFQPAPVVDVNAAIQRAQNTRTDVLQAKKNVAINDVTLRFLSDQTKPQADLVGRYGVQGIGGTFYQTTGSGINRVVTAVIPGGYGDALSTLVKRNFPTWALTLNFSYPLGMSAQEAAIARAKIQENQVDAQLRQIDLQVATDVSNAAVNVQNGIERVQAAQAARDLAQQQLDAENSKFGVGMSTNYQVVQAQRDLATARNNELQAILAYRRALVEFDRVQQTSTGGNITIVGR